MINIIHYQLFISLNRNFNKNSKNVYKEIKVHFVHTALQPRKIIFSFFKYEPSSNFDRLYENILVIEGFRFKSL